MTWHDISPDSLQQTDAIVQLAGAPIMDKWWVKSRKDELVRSRVEPNQTLVRAIREMDEVQRPKVFVCGSAIGYYPVR